MSAYVLIHAVAIAVRPTETSDLKIICILLQKFEGFLLKFQAVVRMDQPPYCPPRQGSTNGGSNSSSSGVRLPSSHLTGSVVPHPPPAMIFGQQRTPYVSFSYRKLIFPIIVLWSVTHHLQVYKSKHFFTLKFPLFKMRFLVPPSLWNCLLAFPCWIGNYISFSQFFV